MKHWHRNLLGLLGCITAISIHTLVQGASYNRYNLDHISAEKCEIKMGVAPPDSAAFVGMTWNEMANKAMVSIGKRNLGPGTMSGRVTALAVPRKSPF